MIIETITVTTTPTSLKALIETARGTTLLLKSCQGIIIRNDSGVIILGSDPETDTPITLLDPAVPQNFESHIATNIGRTLLSVGAGTAVVGVVISQ